MRKGLLFLFLIFFLCALGSSSQSMAQEISPEIEQLLSASNQISGSKQQSLEPPQGETGFGYPDLTSQALVLVLLALLPFIVMLMTSFLKIVITLALLRNALGVQQTPPNQVLNGIALILTIYVMFPTGMEMYEKSKHLLVAEQPKQLFSADTASLAIAVFDEAKEPLRDFLVRNSKKSNLDGFYKLALKSFPESVRGSLSPTDYIVVVPSFITSQLKAAFEIGVLIYLPFFVIDLVTSNILLAMQMLMLSPLSIALPIKLLMIVLIDGWTVLIQGLVLSFN